MFFQVDSPNAAVSPARCSVLLGSIWRCQQPSMADFSKWLNQRISCRNCGFISDWSWSLNVTTEHHPTMRYLIYNCHSKVMSNSPKMGHLPILLITSNTWLTTNFVYLNGWIQQFPACLDWVVAGYPKIWLTFRKEWTDSWDINQQHCGGRK